MCKIDLSSFRISFSASVRHSPSEAFGYQELDGTISYHYQLERISDTRISHTQWNAYHSRRASVTRQLRLVVSVRSLGCDPQGNSKCRKLLETFSRQILPHSPTTVPRISILG